MVVNPDLPAKTLADFVSYAKANSGKINAAITGPGSPSRLLNIMFQKAGGFDLTQVPYRGDAPALLDLMSNQVQMYFSTLPPAMELVNAGKLRALAVTGAGRFELFPALPAIAEVFPGFEGNIWNGFGAPKGTPADIIQSLNIAINSVLADASLKSQLNTLGLVIQPASVDGFKTIIAAETENWGHVIRENGIKPE